ncbi:MAG: methionine--tRNA ligase [Candidatus Adiutrix sp.]|jgi:methionyl-tRNA synthetase|nr:methionine--tRNA ligase [Candidatus Adiutrix sp.]
MRFYATTPIYYVNAKPHLGHAYTTIITDAFRRFHHLAGAEARFITGTDEHGDKIAQAAEQNGRSPREYADRISALFQAAWPRLNIEPGGFIRTTEERHRRAVTAFLDLVNKKGDIYFGKYGGHYCVGCERFYTEKELVDGLCPDHRTPPRYVEEENYFFRMSAYQDWLIDHIRQNPDFIRPERYRNEVLGLLREPLEDLCISRPKSRLTWGIDLPFDDKFVTYVWFDALISYISAIGWPGEETFGHWWPGAQHFIAKDILKPHAVFWPTMLKSAGLPLFRHLNVHGYWQLGRAKMGKSIGNAVDALALSETYGAEAFRYFLARDMAFGLDSEFVEDALVNRYNADLANDLGNLWQRSLTMLTRFGGGVIPEAGDGRELPPDPAGRLAAEYRDHFQNLAAHKALGAAWELIGSLNKLIDAEAPWVLAKDPDRAERLKAVLRRLVEGLALAGALIWPVMPRTGEEMWRRLGLDLDRMSLEPGEINRNLAPGREVAAGPTFFPRVEFGGLKAATRAESENRVGRPGRGRPTPEATAPEATAGIITFDEFKRLDLRVAEILAAEAVPKSNKLLNLRVSLGSEERGIVAGLARHFRPEELVGRLVIVAANLAPAKLMGLTSQGMVLAAARRGEGEGEEKLTLLTTSAPIEPGAKVS